MADDATASASAQDITLAGEGAADANIVDQGTSNQATSVVHLAAF